MEHTKLSIIILNYKTKHLLRLVIKSLLSLQLPFKYEIIIVDNNSQDGSVEMVRELYPKVTLIANPKNTGHAHGNNIGIAAATGEHLLIMNTDIIFFSPVDICKIVDYLDHHPEVGLVGPRLRNADGTVQYSCFRPYSRFTPIFRRTPLGKLPAAKRDLENHLMVDFDHNELREVDWILGACIFVRRDILEQLGAFNESFFLYFADFELCDRLRNQGYKIIYYADVNIIHYHRRESAQRSIWGGLGSILNYVTRIHLRDWLTYRTIAKHHYGSDT